MAKEKEKEPKFTEKHRHILAVTGLSIAVGLCWLAAAAAIVGLLYQNRVEPRTVVAGVNIGSQSLSSANSRVQTRIATLATTPITFSLNDTTQTLTPTDLGVTFNSSATVLPVATPGLNWFSPVFWYDFFRPKTVAPSYTLDSNGIEQVIEQKFNVAINPQNASLSVNNGQLAVNAAVAGLKLDMPTVENDLKNKLATGGRGVVTIATTKVSSPVITTEQAAAVAQTITETLHPVSLQGGGKQFTVSVADQYNLISYSTDNNKLTWQIDKDKVQGYLKDTVAKTLNVKMVAQVNENGTGNLVTAGVNGQTVNLTSLTSTVYQALTAQSADQPTISIPITTTPFTQTTVDPGYIANLFPGLYVDINLSKQRMYIMDGANVTQEFLISSGIPSLPTPVGQFYVMNKISLARSSLYPALWMPEWNALTDDPNLSAGSQRGYGIHALPCFNIECTLTESAAHLGEPVSHGCVRLSDANAVWFFQNIPVGTPVNIHK